MHMLTHTKIRKGRQKTTVKGYEEKDKIMEILSKDLEVIGEILSSLEKTKIFLLVHKLTEQQRGFISGYRLYLSVSLSVSAVYRFLEKMVNYDVFERPSQIMDIKWVRITEYGNYIYEKIKAISPKISEIL